MHIRAIPGMGLPRYRATIIEPSPERIPLTVVICMGSFSESFLVQLFSIPQQKHAPRTRRAPGDSTNPEMSSTDSSMLETVTRSMAVQRVFDTFSLKTMSAITVVATISKLFNKDVVADDVMVNPVIRRIGAAMSRTIMAMVYGRSERSKGASWL